MSKNKNRKTENAPYGKNGMQTGSENKKGTDSASPENKKSENNKG